MSLELLPYNQSLSLLTDLYQLTMSYGYFKNNKHEDEAVFHLFYRKNPFKGSFAIAAGLAPIVDYINNFKITSDDSPRASFAARTGKAISGLVTAGWRPCFSLV